MPPRVVEVKKPPAKPKVVSQKDLPTEEDYSMLIDTPRDELRKTHLQDITPSQPGFGPLQGDELRKKIEEDRKKRRGLGGEVKDLFGLK